MGTSNSSTKRENSYTTESSLRRKSSKQNLSNQAAESKDVEEIIPYHGIPCNYYFIQKDIPFKTKLDVHFLGKPDIQMTSPDMESYVPLLNELYSEGNRLLSFQMTPGSEETTCGFLSADTTTTLRAQAIFRTNEPKLRSDEMYRLEVVKSLIESGDFLTHSSIFSHYDLQIQTHSQHLYQMIHDHAGQGGRLRCIEVTGCSSSLTRSNPKAIQTMGIGGTKALRYENGIALSRDAVYGVDLFFEMPLHSSPELFHYKAVPIKMKSKFTMSITSLKPNWDLQFDWQGLMLQYLGSGWRLVEIFNDMSVDTSTDVAACCKSATTYTLNLIFIFEKPESRQDDNTPVYEGTMVEFNATETNTTSGLKKFNTTIDTDWDEVISSMGKDGWEFITVVQTPISSTKVKLNGAITSLLMLMFFQRAIISDPE